MDAIKYIYNNFKYEKKKERFEMILEPLQAIIQIALLSYCPLGTKISISNNILYIQQPGYTQFIIRNYNYDKKEDLIYLFTVIKRFHKFYGFLNDNNNNKMKELFNLLIVNSKLGIDNLVKTYSDSETNHLTQTLRMYKSLLDKPEAFIDGICDNINNDNDNESIDNVFEGLVNLYNKNIYIIILNIFRLLEENPNDYIYYINAIECIMNPINIKIKNWINDKIVL